MDRGHEIPTNLRTGTSDIEAKFGSSGLTGAQKDLKNQMGDAFTVSRTTGSEVGGAAGKAAAAVGGALSSCASGTGVTCKE